MQVCFYFYFYLCSMIFKVIYQVNFPYIVSSGTFLVLNISYLYYFFVIHFYHILDILCQILLFSLLIFFSHPTVFRDYSWLFNWKLFKCYLGAIKCWVSHSLRHFLGSQNPFLSCLFWQYTRASDFVLIFYFLLFIIIFYYYLLIFILVYMVLYIAWQVCVDCVFNVFLIFQSGFF